MAYHRYILACFVFIFCRVDGESLYGLKGLSVTLKPDIPGKPMEILWKHKGNKVVEFNGNEEQVYGTFKNRITLDWHTADIEITDLRFEDSGNYELEVTIKNMLHRPSKTLVVIDKVPKPTISCEMNNGSSSYKSGTLECSAESKDRQTQSLTKFEWKSHENVQPGRQLTISLGDKHDDHEYICNVSNPMSSETTTFTAKECYPDESSSVALAAGLVIPFLIIFVVLGVVYICYRKRKACFAVKGDDAEKQSPPSENNHNDEESQPFLHTSAANQSPGMADGNSQNVDEEYQQGQVKERIKMFEREKDEKMSKDTAPHPVPLRRELFLEPAKEEDPQNDPSVSKKANEPDQAAESGDLEDNKPSESSSTAPEDAGLVQKRNMEFNKINQEDEKMNKDTTPPPVPLPREVFPEPAKVEDPQNDPSVSEKANESDQAAESDDLEDNKTSESSSTAPEKPDEKMNKNTAPPPVTAEPAKEEDPQNDTLVSKKANESDQAVESAPKDPDEKINKDMDPPPVPPELAKVEDPQNDPSVSEKANESDQAAESDDLEDDKTSESSSTAPEKPDEKMNKDTAPLPVPPEPAKGEDPQNDTSVSEKANKPDQADESALKDPGLHETAAQGDRSSSPIDKAEADQPSKVVEKGLVQKRKMEFNRISQKGTAPPPVPLPREVPPELAKEEDPQNDPSVSKKANESDQGDESANLEDDKTPESSSTAPEKPELKQEAENDEEANVPSDSVSPSAKAPSSLTQNSPNVAPENAAGEQSQDMDKPVSTPENEPVNEETDEEKDLSQEQPQSPIPTKTNNDHTNTVQDSPDIAHKTSDQEEMVKTTPDSDESSEDEDETVQCGPKEEKPESPSEDKRQKKDEVEEGSRQ